MHQFSKIEIDRLQQLVNFVAEQSNQLTSFFTQTIFTAHSGQALIVQDELSFAVLYLSPAQFNQPSAKAAAVEGLFDWLRLIQTCIENGLIILDQSNTNLVKSIYYLQATFTSPLIEENKIILTEDGAYTDRPETIFNSDGSILYQGVVLKNGVYAIVRNNLLGNVQIQPALYQCFEVADSASAEELPDLHQPTQAKKMQTTYKWMLAAGIAACVAITGWMVYWMQLQNRRIKQTEATSQQYLTTIQQLLKQKENSVSVNQETERNLSDDAYAVLQKPGWKYGIDVSKANGPILKVADNYNRLNFFIIKATEGITFLDKEFKENWQLLSAKKSVKGAYHFYREGDDPIEQGNFYLDKLGQLGVLDISPIVDVEAQSFPYKSKWPSADTIQQHILTLLHHLAAKTNRVPIIYCNFDFAKHYLTHPDFARYHLWLAEYRNPKTVKAPGPWKEVGYKILQRSDTYTLKQVPKDTLDFDVYYGKLADITQ